MFAPREWLSRAELIRRESELVVLHLGIDAGIPAGFEVLGSADFEQWRVVAGVPV